MKTPYKLSKPGLPLNFGMAPNFAAALAYYPKNTYQRTEKLYRFFIRAERIWQAEFDEIVRAGLDDTFASEFIAWREAFPVEKITTDLEQQEIHTVALSSDDYPTLLKQITDPPRILFYRGTLPAQERPAIAIVGTRKCSPYGKQITGAFAASLATQGMVIVSGLALGIDGVAHDAALEVHGHTVAVLGSGVDKPTVYPAAHHGLAERIVAAGGAILSEYPPGFLPTQYSFPARNRIIAGLSRATLVTEAPKESGALITSSCALDYNRDVFAVPHAITNTAGEGCNELIKKGAALVTEPNDILEAMQIKHIEQIVASNAVLPQTGPEAALLALLSQEPKHIDEIIKQSGLPSAQTTGTLTLLEMKGKIKNVGGMKYVVK